MNINYSFSIKACLNMAEKSLGTILTWNVRPKALDFNPRF